MDRVKMYTGKRKCSETICDNWLKNVREDEMLMSVVKH